ncbi:uncharacterized protein LOC132631536 isoform X1 [Lycium barbarum]|uniref:uncharacterized protein LOC132631536 isoform X1 n=1 Tax=Lycium barbarum TaxID=112863 RepID=UPI00293F2AAC|nr:uncharacterized protein LOC132631536 isoform X1 [Lycium barbarum]XP_060203098.1 uncharacterized protein LOC132631536 isoform X1 [Lycium barbarum]
MKNVMNRFFSKESQPTVQDLQIELISVKNEIKNIKTRLNKVEVDYITDQIISQTRKESLAEDIERNISEDEEVEDHNDTIETDNNETPGKVQMIKAQSWHIFVTLRVGNIVLEKLTLVDSGADKNCIMEGLIPTKHLDKSTAKLYSATGEKLKINYKLSKGHICNDGICFINEFVVTRDINESIILGTPFITQIKPYYADLDAIYTTILGKEIKFPYLTAISQEESDHLKNQMIFKINCLSNQVSSLKNEIKITKIEQTLKTPGIIGKINSFQKQLEREVCSDLPNAFWERKRHVVELPYIDGFNEQAIPTKARPIQMNHELMEVCKTEINDLLQKKIIRPSRSPWSCSAFYVNKNAEKKKDLQD